MTLQRSAASFMVLASLLGACTSELTHTPIPSADAGAPGSDAARPTPTPTPTPTSPDGGAPAQYSVGGTVSGLSGSGLVLESNTGESIAIAKDGAFSFPQKRTKGSAFEVRVKTQPTSPAQTCTVNGGSGSVVAGDVRSISVSCATDAFTVGGTAAGLAGEGLVLQNGGADDVTVNALGSFAFPTPLLVGASYSVTIKTQPSDPSQTCTVTNGEGVVTSENVTTVEVSCTTNTFSIGGKVEGLSGSGLVLDNGAGEEIAIDANGDFSFVAPVSSGSSYAVSVKTQPSSPSQTCTVTKGSGIIRGEAVADVAVLCETNTYRIGGTVTGLTGSPVILKNNGGDELTLTENGAFSFPVKLEFGASYSVKVATHPTKMYCLVAHGKGVVGDAEVSNVAIECMESNGSVLDVDGNSHRIMLLPCGDGSNTNCTKDVATATCTAIGAKLVSHASDGTSSVASLGATTSCQWSISYYTNDAPELAGQCLIGMSNVDWTPCCNVQNWHGNVVTIPSTVGQQFGFVEEGNSGYDASKPNQSGTTWGCNSVTEAPPAHGDCSTYHVACQW